jgi:hypothetical protein
VSVQSTCPNQAETTVKPREAVFIVPCTSFLARVFDTLEDVRINEALFGVDAVSVLHAEVADDGVFGVFIRDFGIPSADGDVEEDSAFGEDFGGDGVGHDVCVCGLVSCYDLNYIEPMSEVK